MCFYSYTLVLSTNCIKIAWMIVGLFMLCTYLFSSVVEGIQIPFFIELVCAQIIQIGKILWTHAQSSQMPEKGYTVKWCILYMCVCVCVCVYLWFPDANEFEVLLSVIIGKIQSIFKNVFIPALFENEQLKYF